MKDENIPKKLVLCGHNLSLLRPCLDIRTVKVKHYISPKLSMRKSATVAGSDADAILATWTIKNKYLIN
jgi:hypothetical protein